MIQSLGTAGRLTSQVTQTQLTQTFLPVMSLRPKAWADLSRSRRFIL